MDQKPTEFGADQRRKDIQIPSSTAQNMVENSDPRVNVRPMVRTELSGSHTHVADDGTEIHIWRRADKFLARGSWQGHRFGHTLGNNRRDAQVQLRALLGDIDHGVFERASDRTRQVVRIGIVPKLTLPELINSFVADVRRRKGKNTADTYVDRLAPGLEFADQHAKRWSRAVDIDHSFAAELKAYLYQRRVTPNGHPTAESCRMAPGQILNVLSCWSTLVNWATKPEMRRLPAGFPNPFSHDIVGQRPRRDPLAPPTFPLELRVQMVAVMDAWQLTVMTLSLILPERPEDFVGLLVSEVDRVERQVRFGTRCDGDDTTKSGVAFHVPYPEELDPVIDWLIAGRKEGPLLQARRVRKQGKTQAIAATTSAELELQFDQYLAHIPPNETTCAQDRKKHFRRFLLKLGGISTDTLAREFHKALQVVRPDWKARFYDVKGSVTTDMKSSGMDYITRMYLTGHSLSGEILASYESQRLHEDTANYYRHIAPLLAAIRQRAIQVGIIP
ncbi:MAG: hypothetical protein WCI73_04595 [Phycisphaerae bacterium]